MNRRSAVRAKCNSSATQGVFFLAIAGDRNLPAVATRDIAAAAARLLLADSWSGVDEVPLLGPEGLSFNDMAEITSEVLGKEVRYQQIPFRGLQGPVRRFRDVRGYGAG